MDRNIRDPEWLVRWRREFPRPMLSFQRLVPYGHKGGQGLVVWSNSRLRHEAQFLTDPKYYAELNFKLDRIMEKLFDEKGPYGELVSELLQERYAEEPRT